MVCTSMGFQLQGKSGGWAGRKSAMLRGITGCRVPGLDHSMAKLPAVTLGPLTLFSHGTAPAPTQQDSTGHAPLNEHWVPFLPTCARAVDGCVETFPVFLTTYRVVT